MTDILGQINQTHREVRSGQSPAGERRSVVLRRRYGTPVAEVWDACTSAERIPRWFLPVTGDLRPGGTFQLEGNAGGEILRCEPPHLLRVTWVFGDLPRSEVELRLSAGGGGGTVLELEHIVATDAMWERFGPGAVGVGWDLALLGLGLHLSGQGMNGADAQAWLASPEGRQFVTRASTAWGDAFAAAGASAGEAAAAARHTTQAYTSGAQN